MLEYVVLAVLVLNDGLVHTPSLPQGAGAGAAATTWITSTGSYTTGGPGTTLECEALTPTKRRDGLWCSYYVFPEVQRRAVHADRIYSIRLRTDDKAHRRWVEEHCQAHAQKRDLFEKCKPYRIKLRPGEHRPEGVRPPPCPEEC